MISQVQLALREKLQQELQQEQVVWYAYPDPTRRAKQMRLRSPFPWWIVSRIILLLGMLIVVIFTSVLARSTTFLLIPLYGGVLLFVVVIWMVLMVQRRSTARRRLKSTLYAITTRRLVVITLDRGQFIQNSYVPQDLGRIDLIERLDGWGDVIIGSPRVQSGGYSLAVVSPRLSGVERVREVAALLTRLKTEQRFAPPHNDDVIRKHEARSQSMLRNKREDHDHERRLRCKHLSGQRSKSSPNNMPNVRLSRSSVVLILRSA